MFFANAYWGLLPIIAKDTLGGNAAFFGTLMGAVGVGAVLGAFLLPPLKARFSANQLVMIGTFGTAVVTGLFAIVEDQSLAIAVSLIFGASWVLVLSSVNVSAQQALPEWVRARGLAVFMVVFYGSMSLGSAFWGWLASVTSVEASMLAASSGGIAFIFASFRSRLQQGQDLDLKPSNHWPEPVIHDAVAREQGPVIIQICYEVATEDRDVFLRAVYLLKAARQRDGAYNWGVYEDAARQGIFIEHFVEDSWMEHLRHHERVTRSDVPLQCAVRAFHRGEGEPGVQHFLAVKPYPKKAFWSD